MKRRLLALAILGFGSPGIAYAQSPSLTRSVPSALTPGHATTVTIHGENLSGATELWTSFPGQVTLLLPSADAGSDASK